MKNKIISFLKAQPVFTISFIAAVISLFFIPPDKKYFNYINYSVIIQLFSLMTSVAGLRQAGILDKITQKLLNSVKSLRLLGLILVAVCGTASMFLTNDVALITFVPLTLLLFSKIKNDSAVMITVIAETVAANLGSMMTPFGNPQNLFLYNEYNFSITDFLVSVVPVGAVGLVMSLALCFLLPNKKISSSIKENSTYNKYKTSVFFALFILCILTVVRIIPVYVCLVLAFISALITDYKILSKVDYFLLLTFVCFFVFVGNISRIDTIQNFFHNIISGNELIVSIILSQIISNVPAAVMLSGFTENGKVLMLGTDIGGLGTLIASLASLISFQFFKNSYPSKTIKYIGLFSLINFSMLILITGGYLILT